MVNAGFVQGDNVSSPGTPSTIDGYGFLGRQVGCFLISLAILASLFIIGSMSGPIPMPVIVCLLLLTGITIGFLVNLAGIVILLQNGPVRKKQLIILAIIFAIFFTIPINSVISTTLGKQFSVAIDLLFIFFAELTALLSISFE